MKIRRLHNWAVTTAQARSIQEKFRSRVVKTDRFRTIRYVAGVDVGIEKSRNLTHAAVAVLDLAGLELVERASAAAPIRFPYVPGHLSFRGIPAICKALRKLKRSPDLILCDGQGYAHPRRFGLACHLGLITDRPCIGVGKSRLIGTHRAVPNVRGRWVSLIHEEEEIGAVLRSRKGVKPIFVSIGHRVSLPTAIEYVMRCVTRYRLPETTRWADRLAVPAQNRR